MPHIIYRSTWQKGRLIAGNAEDGKDNHRSCAVHPLFRDAFNKDILELNASGHRYTHLDLENKLQRCLDVAQNRVKGFAQRKDTFSLAATKLSLWTEQRIDVKYDT